MSRSNEPLLWSFLQKEKGKGKMERSGNGIFISSIGQQNWSFKVVMPS